MSPALNLENATPPYERRRSRRYRIRAAAHLFLSGMREEAETVDISSGGVFLKSRNPLPLGRKVQLLLDWPALLDGTCPLRLMIDGKVLRSSRDGTALRIIRYDYRTRSRL
jgi:hypothetical protein